MTGRGVAFLPAYDLPEVREATDALWTAIAARLDAQGIEGVPVRLTRSQDLALPALHPRLVLTQTCGYLLCRSLAGQVRLVATPRYSANGCAGSDYVSFVVVPEASDLFSVEDLRGKRCAVNDVRSHSGMNAIRAMVAPLARGGRFFGGVQITGSHVETLRCVATGAADAGAIDCVTHALLARHRRHALEGTRVLAWTAPAPALPYVTRADADEALVEALRLALSGAIEDPAIAGARVALLLEGVEVPPPDYDRIGRAEDLAVRHGYPTLL